MTQTTPNLALPLIMPSQAQKHVTHNEAIELLDAFAQLVFEQVDTTTPPATANEGQAWALGAAPTGEWSGQGGQIAMWRGGGWMFVAPKEGWTAWSIADSALCVRLGGTWTVLATAAIGP